jgi:hypothetical protein
MSTHNDLLEVCRRLQSHGVRYILVGGQAVRLNGIVRATEDIDILVPFDEVNGRRIIASLEFLDSAREIDPHWFTREANESEIQNIRVADRIVVDILFAANGETYDSLFPHVRELTVEDVTIRVLDLEGLLRTKGTGRDKDELDAAMLSRLKDQR